MTSTETTAEQAPRPPAEAIEPWLRLTDGDEYAALLCATAEAAATRALDAMDDLHRDACSSNADARTRARRVRDEARADVADYYGETLGDQHPAVRRAAGFRA